MKIKKPWPVIVAVLATVVLVGLYLAQDLPLRARYESVNNETVA